MCVVRVGEQSPARHAPGNKLIVMPDKDNPNLTLEEYQRKQDVQIRMFAIEAAIKSAGPFVATTLRESAQDIYDFVNGKTD